MDDQIFEFSSSSNADGRTTLVYGSPANELNLNFASQTLIRIDVVSYDYPSSLALPVTLTLESGLSGVPASSLLTRSLSAASGFINFSLADFTDISLTDIDRLTFSFDAPRAADFQVASIISIPELSSSVMILVTLGLGLMRRRRA